MTLCLTLFEMSLFTMLVLFIGVLFGIASRRLWERLEIEERGK